MSVNVNVGEILRLREIADECYKVGLIRESEDILAICNNIDAKRNRHNQKVRVKKNAEREKNPYAQRSRTEIENSIRYQEGLL